MAKLTDDQILDAIFNNHGEIALPSVYDATPRATAAAAAASLIDDSTLMQLKQLEQDAVGQAEQGDLAAAHATLSRAVTLCPVYASAYNNRAQVLRLLGRPDEAYDDLCKAIDHGTTTNSQQTLKQAYTQRAIIKRSRGDEAGADQDFAKGAQYGNEIARGMVKNNPYAKLCNAMVTEAMARLADQRMPL
ncbi:hypothetical protein BC831DRAFT_474051 [Entophlyctis helioformis]|nr:hypothetical protein BC831DRAFT_474051 [Entophlyctis helioformis]